MTSQSVTLTGDQTFKQMTDLLSRNSASSQAQLRELWLEARDERLKQFRSNMELNHQQVQRILDGALEQVARLDRTIEDLLGDWRSYQELRRLSQSLKTDGLDPIAWNECEAQIKEYARLAHSPDSRSSMLDSHHVIVDVAEQVSEILGAKLIKQKEEILAKLETLVEGFNFRSAFDPLKDLLALEFPEFGGKTVLRSLELKAARVRNHLSEFSVEAQPAWDRELSRRLASAGRTFQQLVSLLENQSIPFQAWLVKAASAPADEVRAPQRPDLRESLQGRVFLLLTRHLDSVSGAIEGDAPRAHEEESPTLEFVQTAIREREQMLRQLVADFPVHLVEASLVSLTRPEIVSEDISEEESEKSFRIHEAGEGLRELLRRTAGELEDTAILLALEYTLPEDVALQAARSRFASNGLDGFCDLLANYKEVNPLFGEIVRSYPNLLLLRDSDVGEYLEQLRAVHSTLESSSPLLLEYFSSARKFHESTSSLTAYAKEVAEVTRSPKLLKEAELSAVREMTYADLLKNRERGITDTQYQLGADILSLGFMPTNQNSTAVGQSRDIDSMRKLIERVSGTNFGNPLIYETIELILEGSTLLCTSKSEVRPGHRTYKFNPAAEAPLDRVLQRIRECHEPRAVDESKPQQAGLTAIVPAVTQVPLNGVKQRLPEKPANLEQIGKLKSLQGIILGAQEALAIEPQDAVRTRNLITEYRRNLDSVAGLASRLRVTMKRNSAIDLTNYRSPFERACYHAVLRERGNASQDSTSTFRTEKWQQPRRSTISAARIETIIRDQAINLRPDTKGALETGNKLYRAIEPLLHLQVEESVAKEIPAVSAMLEGIEEIRMRIEPVEKRANNLRQIETVLSAIWPDAENERPTSLGALLLASSEALESRIELLSSGRGRTVSTNGHVPPVLQLENPVSGDLV